MINSFEEKIILTKITMAFSL